MSRKFLNRISILALLVASAILLAACGESRAPFVGTYQSDEVIADKGHIELVLRDNGEADWKWGETGNTIKFKWRAQDRRVWLYTKEGAIIIATPSDGTEHLSVDMTGEWHEGCPTEKCITFTRLK
jgi:hypothetical protein